MRSLGPFFSKKKGIPHVNPLLISDDDGNNHYSLFNDFSRVMTKKKTNVTESHIYVMVAFSFSHLLKLFHDMKEMIVI